ncbi:hypothetical protein AG1IA_06478 [Rhizoctonia solani AG-1 IA]|uniref:Uncharacterized protein n=1 Tax=Thanatephorus cucumeris (strain AG1-IA) TaxID=983506 RepID=L8WMV7_THACA|nr:hypothetical protein AG1IA_06478 [Rhizoctonia solani AG-1 IA]
MATLRPASSKHRKIAQSYCPDLPYEYLHYHHLRPINGIHFNVSPIWSGTNALCKVLCTMWTAVKYEKRSAQHTYGRGQRSRSYPAGAGCPKEANDQCKCLGTWESVLYIGNFGTKRNRLIVQEPLGITYLFVAGTVLMRSQGSQATYVKIRSFAKFLPEGNLTNGISPVTLRGPEKPWSAPERSGFGDPLVWTQPDPECSASAPERSTSTSGVFQVPVETCLLSIEVGSRSQHDVLK